MLSDKPEKLVKFSENEWNSPEEAKGLVRSTSVDNHEIIYLRELFPVDWTDPR